MTIRWGRIAQLLLGLGAASSAFSAGQPIKRLQVVAIDESAQFAVIKLDDQPQQVWRNGESLMLGVTHAKLRECAGNRLVVEIAAGSASIPVVTLIPAGGTYRLDVDRTVHVPPPHAVSFRRASQAAADGPPTASPTSALSLAIPSASMPGTGH